MAPYSWLRDSERALWGVSVDVDHCDLAPVGTEHTTLTSFVVAHPPVKPQLPVVFCHFWGFCPYKLRGGRMYKHREDVEGRIMGLEFRDLGSNSISACFLPSLDSAYILSVQLVCVFLDVITITCRLKAESSLGMN